MREQETQMAAANSARALTPPPSASSPAQEARRDGRARRTGEEAEGGGVSACDVCRCHLRLLLFSHAIHPLAFSTRCFLCRGRGFIPLTLPYSCCADTAARPAVRWDRLKLLQLINFFCCLEWRDCFVVQPQVRRRRGEERRCAMQ